MISQDLMSELCSVAVDPQSRNNILEGIQKLNKQGATIIYTSHYMEEVEQICSRICIMDQGRSIATGTTDELKRMIRNTENLQVEVFNLTKDALDELGSLPHAYGLGYNNNILTISYNGGKHNVVRVLDYLQENEYTFGKVYSELPTLNDVFLEITGTGLRDTI